MQEIIANFLTDDMEQTLAFYRDVLGFKVTNSVPDKEPYDWVNLGKDKGNIMFQTRDSINKELDIWKDGELGASMILYIIVDDIKALFSRVEGKAEIVKPLNKTFYQMEEFAIKDNNGYVLTFGSPA